jgi:fumarate reductase flavoprotein subunit
MTGASGASAVVLATGGFLRDRDEVDRVAPSLAGRRLVFETNPTSDGGGLPFLQAVGAGSLSPEHIGIYVHSITDFGMGDGEALVAIGAENGIMVDAAGERFADETLQRSLDLFDQLPEGEVYAILPESVAPFVQFMRPYYNWSNPPNPEILPMSDVLGHADDVYSGASIEEVADAAGIDPVGLAATVEEWNAEVATGGPDPFGRDLATAHPMTGSQFVALRLTPGLAKAFGGVATDEEAHVLDASGTPIPGLYAAGEVAGMVLGGGGGHGFEGSVGACYWGGRVAGASAAAFAGP